MSHPSTSGPSAGSDWPAGRLLRFPKEERAGEPPEGGKRGAAPQRLTRAVPAQGRAEAQLSSPGGPAPASLRTRDGFSFQAEGGFLLRRGGPFGRRRGAPQSQGVQLAVQRRSPHVRQETPQRAAAGRGGGQRRRGGGGHLQEPAAAGPRLPGRAQPPRGAYKNLRHRFGQIGELGGRHVLDPRGREILPSAK